MSERIDNKTQRYKNISNNIDSNVFWVMMPLWGRKTIIALAQEPTQKTSVV